MDKRLGALIELQQSRWQSQRQCGASLIEIIIALVIIGLMATAAFSLLSIKRKENTARYMLLNDINALLAAARTHAILYQKDQRIVWDLVHKKIAIKPHEPQQSPPNAAVTSHETCRIPSSIMLVEFLINGINELAQGARKVTECWFLISRYGVAQPVIINGIDRSATPSQSFSIVVNPFSVQCSLYDIFQK